MMGSSKHKLDSKGVVMNDSSHDKIPYTEQPSLSVFIFTGAFVILFPTFTFFLTANDAIEIRALKVIVSFLLPLSALGVTLSFGIFKRRSEKYQFISILVYSFVMSLTVIASAAILRWDHGDVFEKTLSDSLTSFCIVTIALIGGLIYLDKHQMLSRKK